MNTRVLKERVTERLGRKLCAFVFTLSKHRGTLKGEESAPVWIMLGSMENNVALPCCEGEPELGQHIQTTCEPVFTCLQDDQCRQRPLHVLAIQVAGRPEVGIDGV